MAHTRFRRIDDMFEMVRWSPEEEKYMADMLIEYAGNHKLFGDDYKVSALTSIASQLTVKFNRTFSYINVEKKFKSLHDRFKLWDVIIFWPGVRLNLTTRKWETIPSTWEAIIKEHPAAKRLVTEGEMLGIELSVIFSRRAESKYQSQVHAEIAKLERGIGILKNTNESVDSVSDRISFIKMEGDAFKSSGTYLGANSHGQNEVEADNVIAKDNIRKPGNYACIKFAMSSSGSSKFP